MDNVQNNMELPNINLPKSEVEIGNELNNDPSVAKSIDPELDIPSAEPSVNAINLKVKSIISDDSSQPASDSSLVLPPTSSTNPLSASDSDLIEKEWVDKAKQIINKNKEDPYLQSVEISHVRVDYMKKRYNKDIKLSE